MPIRNPDTDSDWGQKLLRFEDFLSKLYQENDDKQKVYLAQHPLLEQIPQLENDIIVPGKTRSFLDYCNLIIYYTYSITSYHNFH